MAEAVRARADNGQLYEQLRKLPETMVGEIIDGSLYASPAAQAKARQCIQHLDGRS